MAATRAVAGPRTPGEWAVCRVPAPPSANKLYEWGRGAARTGGGTRWQPVRSSEYRAWAGPAATVMRRGLAGAKLPPKTPVEVRIYAQIAHTRDLDNLAKGLLDAMQAADILPDDRYVDRLTMVRVGRRGRVDGTEGGRIRLDPPLDAGWCEVAVRVI